jgi:hypothetical protein
MAFRRINVGFALVLPLDWHYRARRHGVNCMHPAFELVQSTKNKLVSFSDSDPGFPSLISMKVFMRLQFGVAWLLIR